MGIAGLLRTARCDMRTTKGVLTCSVLCICCTATAELVRPRARRRLHAAVAMRAARNNASSQVQ